MDEDVSLAELPDNLKPIKVSQWQEACEWINLRWGKTSWTDDVALYEDAKFWCEDELWGGMQSLLEKGTSFAPTFSELTKAVMEWRQHHLQNSLDKYKVKELPPPAGSLKHYLKSIGAEGLGNKLDGLAKTGADAYERIPAIMGATVVRKAIQKITGDVITNDDIFGGTSGAILNPNTELLFNGSDMRNFQLNFKLVPRNFDEAKEINNICKTFKMCTLPSRNPGEVFAASNQGITAGFIGVPNLCKVNFMSGNDEHKVLPRYKMCAVTQVDVNYTPDGAYATYYDPKLNSQPVAIELSINFQETKLVFSEEIANDSIR